MIDRHEPERLHDFHDGRLSRAASERLRFELDRDESLRAALENLERLTLLLRAVEAPPLAPGFADRVLQRIARLEAEEEGVASPVITPPLELGRARWEWTSAAAVLVACAATFLLVCFLFRDPGRALPEKSVARNDVPEATRGVDATRREWTEGRKAFSLDGFVPRGELVKGEGRQGAPSMESRMNEIDEFEERAREDRDANRDQKKAEVERHSRGRAFDESRDKEAGLLESLKRALAEGADRPATESAAPGVAAPRVERKEKMAAVQGEAVLGEQEALVVPDVTTWTITVDSGRVREFREEVRAAGFVPIPRVSLGRFAGSQSPQAYVAIVENVRTATLERSLRAFESPRPAKDAMPTESVQQGGGKIPLPEGPKAPGASRRGASEPGAASGGRAGFARHQEPRDGRGLRILLLVESVRIEEPKKR